MTDSKTLVREIVKVLDEKKAMNIVAIETEEVTIVSDFFVIASGMSNTHTKSLADDVEYEIKKRLGIDPEHIEGRATGWILLDYGSMSSSRRAENTITLSAFGRTLRCLISRIS